MIPQMIAKEFQNFVKSGRTENDYLMWRTNMSDKRPAAYLGTNNPCIATR